MNTLVLNLVPGLMMRYDYVHRLLDWLQECIDEIKKHPSTIDYPLIESVLLASLERAAQDVHSVPLVRFAVKLRCLNERLDKNNKAPDDTASVLDNFVR